MSDFSAVDMTTAAAQGFRDGVTSVANSAIPNNQDASAAQGQQVECQECERKQKEIDLLWSDRRKDADLIHQLRTELSALKAQQVGQEPAGEVHLRTGGGISLLHVELAQPLPPGTKLYTAPQPAPDQDVAGLVEALKTIYDEDYQAPHDSTDGEIKESMKRCIFRIRRIVKDALAAHDKQSGGEVQRLREALEHCLEVMKDPWKHGEGCIFRAINRADAALSASTGQGEGEQ